MRQHPLRRAIAGAAIAAAMSPLPGLATGETLTDLRDISVGMPAAQLPAAGYRDRMCTGRQIAAWGEWASCPVSSVDGLRAVHVAYDQPDGQTKVAGHPVDLTVFFDATGRVAKIDIATDGRAPPYLRKKAFMLARQTKAHYGEDGWTCKTAPASADEEAIGPVYINDTCTKFLPGRRVDMSERLFRWKRGTPRDFVSETTITIGMVPPTAK